MHGILERAVTDDHDHGPVAAAVSLGERDTHGRREIPAEPSARKGVEGIRLGDAPCRVKVAEIRWDLLDQDGICRSDFIESDENLRGSQATVVRYFCCTGRSSQRRLDR